MIYRSLLFTLIFSFSSAHASSASLWSDVAFKSQGKNTTTFNLMPDSYRLLNLDEESMRGELDIHTNKQSQEQLTLPLPDGKSLLVYVTENSIMAPELAEQYPQIKTYRVDSHDNKGVYGAIDITPQGFHAMLFMADGTRLFIDPRQSGDTTFYISYYDKHYHPAEKAPFQCDLKSHDHDLKKRVIDASLKTTQRTAHRSGTSLRTYKLAVAATGEYTAFHGGTVVGALSAINTTVSRVNVIYERDLAVKLELVANNNLIIFTDANTDPYTFDSENLGNMLTQNQTEIDTTIGSANYDIGHVVTRTTVSGSGLARLESVCGNNRKARGLTGSSSPSGDAFDIDFVAHEIGHQFGGTHTFNSTTGSCGEGNRESSTAYEPGSGTTILAYAGLCGNSNNTQNNSDAMFHITSIVQMGNFIDDTGGSACGVTSSLSNLQPVSNAGSDYTIPANTPFELIGSGTDANSDTLSYSWEQVDAGTASNIDVVESDNALFRTFLPKDTPTRVFPVLSSILNNTVSKGETLPTSARAINLSLAVRDKKGGVDADEMLLTVSNSNGFKVTSHNSSTEAVLGPNSNTEVTWDVANTDIAPINCSAVNISFSTDSNTFTLVSGNTANDGSETVILPNNTPNSATARFKVKCADNVFFDISDENLRTQTSGIAIQPAIVSNLGTNNVADSGETVHLTIPIENFDSIAATGVSGVLSSSSAADIVVASSSYPDIQPSSEENNTTTYEVKVPDSQNCGLAIPLTLNASYTLGASANLASNILIPVGTASPASQTNSTSQAIPDSDSTGITSSITLTGQGAITQPNISISVDITHTYRGDVTLELTSPQGTTVQLKGTDTSDSIDNLVGNYPNDFTSVQSLSAFDGENLDGAWTLKVSDRFPNDTGTLNSWTINYSQYTCGVIANTAPVASNSNLTTNEGATTTGTLQATDANNNPLTYSIVTNGTKGTAVITNTATGAYTYTPATGQTGQDNFTFKVNDGTVDSNPATVSVTINASVNGNAITNNPSEGSSGGGSLSWPIFPVLMLLSLLTYRNNRKNHLH